jgi:hypothetical protein
VSLYPDKLIMSKRSRYAKYSKDTATSKPSPDKLREFGLEDVARALG